MHNFTAGPPIPVVSLFSGGGGLDSGFVEAGFRPLLAVDLEQAAVDTYNANQEPVAIKLNLLTTTVDAFVNRCLERCPQPPRGLIGGPPCQAFSVGNVHPVHRDPRARLVHRYTSFLRGLHEEFDIDFFVFENVQTLTSPRYGTRYMRFRRALERAGFWLFDAILDAQHFGVPQRRPRLFVVGLNKNRFTRESFEFPKGNSSTLRTVREAIGHLPDPVFFESGLDSSTFPVHPNHWTMVPRSAKFSDGSLQRPHQGRSFRVLAWDKPSWTVAYGNREIHIHPYAHRRLSVYEAMLLQGFPTTYQLKGTLSEQIRLVSEAVPPPLAKAVGVKLADILENFAALSVSRAG